VGIYCVRSISDAAKCSTVAKSGEETVPKAISGYDIHVALCHNQLDLAVLTEELPRLTSRVGGVDDIDAAGGRLVPDAQQVVLEDALRVHVVVAVVADGRQQHGQQRRRAPLTAACRVRHPTGAGGVADSARGRQRRSSPLLSVLLASVGDHRDDDVNAQSILEDHLLRVWDETAAGGVDVVDAADSRRESREFFCQNG